MPNTIVNSKGKTMYLVSHNGVTYGYMTSRAMREFFARKAAQA